MGTWGGGQGAGTPPLACTPAPITLPVPPPLCSGRSASVSDSLLELRDEFVYMKLFKDVLRVDVDMLLPGSVIKFTWIDYVSGWGGLGGGGGGMGGRAGGGQRARGRSAGTKKGRGEKAYLTTEWRKRRRRQGEGARDVKAAVAWLEVCYGLSGFAHHYPARQYYVAHCGSACW